MTSSTLGELCWFNGRLEKIANVRIDPSDRGFTLGDGLFETLLWTGQEIRFFEDHMARMGHGASQLGLSIPFDIASIEQGLLSLAAKSGANRGALRLTLTRGTGPRGLKIPENGQPNLLATLAAVPAEFPPVEACVVDVWRAGGAPSARFKTLSYVDNIVALSMAQAQGADDGLMRGPDESIACATSSNVMIKVEGTWRTPPIEDGALPGIIRGRLIRAGLVAEGRVSLVDLTRCEAACLTNAITGIRPIHTLNGLALDTDPARFESLRAAVSSG